MMAIMNPVNFNNVNGNDMKHRYFIDNTNNVEVAINDYFFDNPAKCADACMVTACEASYYLYQTRLLQYYQSLRTSHDSGLPQRLLRAYWVSLNFSDSNSEKIN
jgi:hypothetical protein